MKTGMSLQMILIVVSFAAGASAEMALPKKKPTPINFNNQIDAVSREEQALAQSLNTMVKDAQEPETDPAAAQNVVDFIDMEIGWSKESLVDNSKASEVRN